jgi:hypothetical protein
MPYSFTLCDQFDWAAYAKLQAVQSTSNVVSLGAYRTR